jgi:hypothetical protein
MSSQQYYEGRDYESDRNLQVLLKHVFDLETFTVGGSTGTKVDLTGYNAHGDPTRFSIKNASGGNTQVHGTTLRAMCTTLAAPDSVVEKLEQWFGTTDLAKFNIWAGGIDLNENSERRRQRFGAQHIPEWNEVLTWLDEVTKTGVLPRLLLQSLNDNQAVDYLVWRNKRTNYIEIVDVHKYVDRITSNCHWIMSRSRIGHNYNIWCVGPEDQKVFSLQMKGSGQGELYHSPQFHTYRNWPREFVVYPRQTS